MQNLYRDIAYKNEIDSIDERPGAVLYDSGTFQGDWQTCAVG